jgi:O-antigen/teichoic acid export membrane protein
MIGLRESMARGAFWMVLAKGVDRSLGLFSTLVLARLLVPGDFGLMAMASSFIAVLEVCGAVGVDLALIRRKDPGPDEYNTAWTLNLMTGVLIAIGMIMFASPISRFFAEPRLIGVLYVLAIGSVLRGLANVGVIEFRKELRFGREFTVQVLPRVVAVALTIPLAIVLQSYWALVIGSVGAQAGAVAISYAIHPLRPRLSLAASREFFHFSKWMFVNNLFGVAYSRSADVVLGRMMGVHALGVFKVAFEIASIPGSELVSPINRAVLPVYARVAGDLVVLRREYLFVFGMIALVAVPAVAGLAAVSPLVIRLLLGPRWEEVVPVLSILAFYGLARVLGSNAYTVCVVLGRMNMWVRTTMVHVAMLLPLLIVFTRMHGLAGAAVAYVVAAFLILPVSIGITTRVLRIRIGDVVAALWRPVLASGLMYACVTSVAGPAQAGASLVQSAVELSLLVGLGVGTYGAAIAMMWWMAGRPDGAERVMVRRMVAGPWRGEVA